MAFSMVGGLMLGGPKRHPHLSYGEYTKRNRQEHRQPDGMGGVPFIIN